MTNLAKNEKNKKIYQNARLMLEAYRAAQWSLEISPKYFEETFYEEYFMTVNEFLQSLYDCGMTFDVKLESRARSINLTKTVLELILKALDTIKEKHPQGEEFYYILYYSYIYPTYLNVGNVQNMLRVHGYYLSDRTFYRKKQEAIEILSTVLWGYDSQKFKSLLAC